MDDPQLSSGEEGSSIISFTEVYNALPEPRSLFLRGPTLQRGRLTVYKDSSNRLQS